MTQYALTTTDNPYNPFTQFEDWYGFDVQKGYFTSSYLSRVIDSFGEEPDSIDEQNKLIEKAIDEIVSINVLGSYVKVSNS